MNNDLILLHNECDNSVVLVSLKNIVCVDTEANGSKRCSKIYVDFDPIDPFVVNETPEKIYAMIRSLTNPTPKKKDNVILS